MRQIAMTLRSCLPRLLSALLALGVSTCAASDEVARLKEDLGKLRQDVEQLQKQRQTELAALQEEDKKLWRNLRCADAQVANFITEAAQCERGQCPQRNLERVLGFMASQKHVLVRLRPNQPPAEMAPSRVSQLRDLLEARQLTGLSRTLMLTMQLNLPKEEADTGEKQADALLLHIRRGLQLAPSVPGIGPFPVTCQNKAQLLDGYAHKFPADRAVAGEPKSKDPQVAIWIFKVDC